MISRMDNYKDTGKVDPDYESYNSALELNEEEDKRENLIKLKKIIEEEYNREIMQRQDQIEQIELQICKVRKLLHLLRYALIMSYYKKKELEYSEEEPSTSESATVDKQNRIHPAVKKLLGKNYHNLDHLDLKDKRKSTSRHVPLQKSSEMPESKKIKLDLEQPKPVEAPKSHTVELIRSRKKTKYRLVVGNISKWMPSSEEDMLTHKWMVYVRGPKDAPDVSRFVQKVVFYLHPSYRPHDVVEVSESPFHLSRRGWGEFPVRVQIFFKEKVNKPIDVVHNIKLDKTYTGRQTLGNETLIDVFLYDGDGLIDVSSTSIEHDYCFATKLSTVNEHSYCLPSEDHPKIKQEAVEQDETNELIYGLDKYLDCGEKSLRPSKTITAQTLNQLLQLNRRDVRFSNMKIIVLEKRLDGSFVTNFNKIVQNPKIDEGGNLRVGVPKNRFKNMGEALPYLFKRLPLYSDLAANVHYKRLYPFTACSLKEFVSWNVGKRRSSEWTRAKTIRKLLLSEKIHAVEKWTTKTVLMYGRSHDHTPFISYGLFTRESPEKHLLLSCFTSSERTKRKPTFRPEDDQEITVDTDVEIETTPKHKTTIDISDPTLKLECSYIRQTALDVGIILKPEEIDEGVKVNAAEIMILEAVKCMAENLIRRAKNHKVCTKIFSTSTSAISKEDVEVAINERPEMLALLQIRNARRNVDYFS